jgi:hypothetical protein
MPGKLSKQPLENWRIIFIESENLFYTVGTQAPHFFGSAQLQSFETTIKSFATTKLKLSIV